MTWEQALVSSQIEVNRAMFEMNKPGMIGSLRLEPISHVYIREKIKAAIRDLQEADAGLPIPTQLRLLPIEQLDQRADADEDEA